MGGIVLSNITAYEPVSMIKSFNVWRELLGQDNFLDVELHLNEYGYCVDCDNRGVVNQKGKGLIRCICDLKYHEGRYSRIKVALESKHESLTFDGFEEWGETNAHRDQTRFLKDSVLDWADSLSNWLVLQGNNGCGKSHLLSALENLFGPWALYLSMPDLEQWYFDSLKQDTGEIDFSGLIEMISRHPILLLDDVGSEHESKFVMSATRKIIDFRYRMYSEFPTVVATNLDNMALRLRDTRIGDRVFDTTRSTVIKTQVKSHRDVTNL